MPRAHRHYVPGYVWHITHRCHQRQFLLQFARDRRTWVRWLYVARRRYGLCVLNYTVTCNHIHLLVRDRGRGEIVASLQLIAGRSGQAYNQRKDRRGAFWEDRYHATAVETGEHLARCLVYIDLNMVRAGVVQHPAEWAVGGYHEIQVPVQRYRIVDCDALAAGPRDLGGVTPGGGTRPVDYGGLAQHVARREPQWSDSIAVGRRAFVEQIAAALGGRVRHRAIEPLGDLHVLRDAGVAYGIGFRQEVMPLSTEST